MTLEQRLDGVTTVLAGPETFEVRVLGTPSLPGADREAIHIDAELPIGAADRSLLAWLKRASPFGAGNPAPVWLARSVELSDARGVGPEGTHLKCVLSDGAASLEAIGFGLGSRRPDVSSGERFDVLFHFEENLWNGRTRLQARLIDFRTAGD